MIRPAALILLLLLPSLSFALNPDRAITQYVYKNYGLDDGLPSSFIDTMVQTKDGYLWLGTRNGLARFNGTGFKVFDSTNTKELTAPEFMSMLETPDGTIWIASYWGGVISYKDGKFRRYGKEQNLTDERAVRLYYDRNKDLWIGTPNGLFRKRGETIERFYKEHGLPGNVVWAMTEDPAGTLLVGTVGGGLFQHKNGKFTKFPGMEEEDILALRTDRQGNVWVGTDDGVFLARGGKLIHYTMKDGLPGDAVVAFLEDRDGNFWMGTNTGLTRFRNGRFENFTAKDGHSGGEVGDIIEDREGNLWYSADGGGVTRLSDGKFVTFAREEGLSDDAINSIHGNESGDIWLATANGISLLRGATVKNFPMEKDFAQFGVWAVMEDSARNLWVGSYGAGLLLLQNGKHVPFSKTRRLLANTVWGLCEDRSGAIWAANFGHGMNRLKGGELESTYTTKEGLPTTYVQGCHQKKDGSFLIITEDAGVLQFADGKFSTYISQSDLGHQVHTIFEDRDGVLWMGSYGGGLKRYDGDRVVAIRKANGLYDDFPGNVLEDSNNNLWITSGKGIFRVGKKQLNDFAAGKRSFVESTLFGKSDGMKSIECTAMHRSSYKSHDGKLWFPTTKGVVMIDPDHQRLNDLPPPVYVEEFLVDEKLASPGFFSPGKEKFEFRYTALSFTAPEKVQFKYMLRGYDKNWVNAGTRRTAYYTHIPPGNYEFRVLASNNDDVWNQTGAAISFRLKPYFYQTPWFFVLCSIAVVAAAFVLHSIRVKRVSAEFKAVMAERTRIAREIHDSLAQALASVVMQLETARLIPTPEKSQPYLDRALVLARQSIQEARRTIADLRPSVMEGKSLPAAARDAVRAIMENSGITLNFSVKGTPYALTGEVETEILRVIQEAVHNAVKHSKAKRIDIIIEYDAAQMRLAIKDDGVGFDMRSVPSEGHFGFTGLRERASQSGAQLSIESAPGKGTTVYLSLNRPY